MNAAEPGGWQTVTGLPGVRIWSKDVRIQTRGGVLALEGYVGTRVEKARLEQAAQAMPNIHTVKSNLYTDTDVQDAVSRALTADPRTVHARGGITVSSFSGKVFLKGQVPDHQTRQAAAVVAAAVPGVRRVKNHLFATRQPLWRAVQQQEAA